MSFKKYWFLYLFTCNHANEVPFFNYYKIYQLEVKNILNNFNKNIILLIYYLENTLIYYK